MEAPDPSPKSHDHVVGFPVDVSVKVVVNPGSPLTGAAVKEAFRSTGVGDGVGGVGSALILK